MYDHEFRFWWMCYYYILTRPPLTVPCLQYRLQRLMIVYFSSKLRTNLLLMPSRRAYYMVSFQSFHLHFQEIRLLLTQPRKISAGSLRGKTQVLKVSFLPLGMHGKFGYDFLLG